MVLSLETFMTFFVSVPWIFSLMYWTYCHCRCILKVSCQQL